MLLLGPAAAVLRPDEPVPPVEPLTPLDTLFPETSWLRAPLPDNTAVHPDSAAGIFEIRRQVAIAAAFNISAWTAYVNVLPADHPLTPVKLLHTGDAALSAVLATGVPIPEGWQPTNDTDAQGYFVQPDYQSPADVTGRIYELQGVRVNTGPDAAQYPFTASYGGRMVGTQNNPGHFISWMFSGYRYNTPGDPDSTYQNKLWGAFATSIPAAGTVVRTDELERGLIRHPVGVEFMAADPAIQIAPVWPAQRRDSGSRQHLPQGTRGRLPAGYPINPEWPRVIRILCTAFRDYGWVHYDTAGAVAIRFEPDAWPYMSGYHSYDLMRMVPWGDMEIMMVGSDANPNPLL